MILLLHKNQLQHYNVVFKNTTARPKRYPCIVYDADVDFGHQDYGIATKIHHIPKNVESSYDYYLGFKAAKGK